MLHQLFQEKNWDLGGIFSSSESSDTSLFQETSVSHRHFQVTLRIICSSGSSYQFTTPSFLLQENISSIKKKLGFVCFVFRGLLLHIIHSLYFLCYLSFISPLTLYKQQLQYHFTVSNFSALIPSSTLNGKTVLIVALPILVNKVVFEL